MSFRFSHRGRSLIRWYVLTASKELDPFSTVTQGTKFLKYETLVLVTFSPVSISDNRYYFFVLRFVDFLGDLAKMFAERTWSFFQSDNCRLRAKPFTSNLNRGLIVLGPSSQLSVPHLKIQKIFPLLYWLMFSFLKSWEKLYFYDLTESRISKVYFPHNNYLNPSFNHFV